MGDTIAPIAVAYFEVAEVVGEKWFLGPVPMEGTILRVASRRDNKDTTWYFDNGTARLVSERFLGRKDLVVSSMPFKMKEK